MKRYKSKKAFSVISKTTITILQTALFSAVWLLYYNDYAFQTFKVRGAVISVIAWMIVYCKMAIMYHAYKIGTYSIAEIGCSQILAIGIADVVMYVECCLIGGYYVNILPGILTAMIQIFVGFIWAIGAKQYFMRKIPPKKTLLIYGADDVDEFKQKILKKYAHLFDIQQQLSSDTPVLELLEAIDESDTVLMYEIGYGCRTELMTYCVNDKKTFFITPRIADVVMDGFVNKHLIDVPLMKYEYTQDRVVQRAIKRTVDIIVSLVGLLVSSPFLIMAAIAIKLEDGGDIFFLQERYTKDWRKFKIIKFRSMIMDAEKDGKPIPCRQGDSRITKVGNILRRFRIDEIPQLINVLRGDMSIVGPRPERTEHVEEYVKEIPEFAYRLRVKGGLTGYAQIYGKYNTTAYDKLKLDLMYIEKQSLMMDLKLMMLTVKTLFTPESTEGF